MKGQSSGEALVTYGWVAIIIIVVVSMLAYLGIFNSLGFGSMPEICVFESGILCSSSRLYENGGNVNVHVSAVNSFPREIVVSGYLCSAEQVNPATGIPARGVSPISITVLPQDKFEFDGVCYKYDGDASADRGDYYKGLAYLRYTFEGGVPMPHTAVANIQGRVN
ncbi:MAG: hypothetical protein NT157_02810 [Candidatus Micrarchaeota archaeon]|nr:hypothetical protein [Candidatus Micrarchaeota archaeon]